MYGDQSPNANVARHVYCPSLKNCIPPTSLAASPGIDTVEAFELDRRVFSTGSTGLTSGLVGAEATADSSVMLADW